MRSPDFGIVAGLAILVLLCDSLPYMSIGAPDVTSDNAANLDNTTKLAKAGNVEEVTFDVKVGGVRGDYNKVENSAKVGTINWTVVAQ